MNIVQKIVALLTDSGVEWPGGYQNAKIVRTHAGRHQRAAGAWSWHLWPIDNTVGVFPSVGSSYPASQIAHGATVGYNKNTRSYELDLPDQTKE